MAGVAARGVIDKAFDSRMLLRDLCLATVLVAGDAGKDGIIGAVGMAVAALAPLAVMRSAVDREVRGVVRRILGAGPVHEGVARVASLREARGRVVRIGRVVVIGLMAAPAGRGGGRIVVADVALAAL